MNNLRLQLAQFNNYIIENYLACKNDVNYVNEPYHFFYKSLIKLNSALGLVGQIIGSIDYVDKEDISHFKDTIAESTTIIYLIESSEDKNDLIEKIKGIYTYYLDYSLNNIYLYGKQFAALQTAIDQEVDEFKADNQDYFDHDGNFKYVAYQPELEVAIDYLGNNCVIEKAKNSFKKLKVTTSYLSDILSDKVVDAADYSNNSLFSSHLLHGLTILLLAFSYVEPFFEKPDAIVFVFETSVNEIMAAQAAILNTL